MRGAAEEAAPAGQALPLGLREEPERRETYLSFHFSSVSLVKNAKTSSVDKRGNKIVGETTTAGLASVGRDPPQTPHLVMVPRESYKTRNPKGSNPNFGRMREGQAVQIMTGLNIHGVGLIWTYLFLSQTSAFGKSYIPLSAATGYPYWSSACTAVY
ncbi:hypothetical protein PANDA_017474 [Ailuropoda melanoleuca]|uniref:Uncharacterized protein n=1 Tax=Ailuropoda melanoleuca TaxID=9646 RepID=D2HXT6_AILME|nr:hypothetical protein PANDA_017474 [Ailuropoda melanoleuca]